MDCLDIKELMEYTKQLKNIRSIGIITDTLSWIVPSYCSTSFSFCEYPMKMTLKIIKTIPAMWLYFNLSPYTKMNMMAVNIEVAENKENNTEVLTPERIAVLKA